MTDDYRPSDSGDLVVSPVRRGGPSNGGALAIVAVVAFVLAAGAAQNSSIRVSVSGLDSTVRTGGTVVATRTDISGQSPVTVQVSTSGSARVSAAPGTYTVQYTPPSGFVIASGANPQTTTPGSGRTGQVSWGVQKQVVATTTTTTATTTTTSTTAGLSRDAGSSAGGVTITIVGSGFASGAQVSFGGTAAATTFISSTQLGAVTPPHAPGTVNVVVSSGGTNTTVGSFEYLPAPTTIYFNSDFEGGTLSPFWADLNGSGTLSLSTDVAFSGTHSARSSTSSTGGNAGLAFTFRSPPNPAVSDPNGLYMRWYVYVPTATYNAGQGTGGQIKMHLLRLVAGSGQPGWVMCGIGYSFTWNGPFTCFIDNTILSFTGGRTTARVGDGIWLEIETWYLRSGGTGRARMWINGKAAFDVTNTLMGYDDPTASIWTRFGGVYVYGATGPTNVYVDNVKAGNGFIDP